jgi:hypothetical protein
MDLPITQHLAIEIVHEKDMASVLSLTIEKNGFAFDRFDSESMFSKKRGIILHKNYKANRVELKVHYYNTKYGYRFIDVLTTDVEVFKSINSQLIKGAIPERRYDGREEYVLGGGNALYIAFGKYGNKYTIGMQNSSHFSIHDAEDGKIDETKTVKKWLKNNK